MRATSLAALGPLVFVLSVAASAAAQGTLPPLPPAGTDQQPPPNTPPSQPPPQPSSEPAPAQQPYAQPRGQQQPPPGYGAPYGKPPEENYEVQPPIPPVPPPIPYTEPPVGVHAPKFSLWAGGRLGVIGFGGNFYQNQLQDGETTGNFVKNGLSVGVDVGVRLGKRYVPYLFIEHGIMGAGHRFEGAGASAASDLLGVGFRYIAGDVDNIGFLTDLSIGLRTITLKNGGDTYKMSSIEIFRLGLGAEIRFSTLFTISPMATLSGGQMTDTEGHIQFSAAGSQDMVTSPTYQDGKQIGNQRGYIVLGLGCGGHFDLFGK